MRLIRDIAAMVEQIVPGSHVKYAAGGGPDLRCYRVNCDKIARTLPAFRTQWTVRDGIEQLYRAYKAKRLTADEFLGRKFIRIRHLKMLLESGELNGDLRWRVPGIRQEHIGL